MIRQKGFLCTFLTSVLIVSLVVAIHYQKYLFVEKSSVNTGIIELVLVLLSISLMLRIYLVRILLAVLSIMGVVYMIFMAMNSPNDFYLMLRTTIFMALLFICYMLVFEGAVKEYANRRIKPRSNIQT